MSGLFTISLILVLTLGALEARELSRKESDKNAAGNTLQELTRSEEAVEKILGETKAESPLAKRTTCAASSQKVGCYKDTNHQALRILLFQDRGNNVTWHKYDEYLHRLVCRCATEAQKRGYTYFGLQSYAACYSAPDASRQYDKYGSSNACVNSYYQKCDDNKANECVGTTSSENYVYIITDEGSGQEFAYDANMEN